MNCELLLKCKETGSMKFWTHVYYEIEKLSVEKGMFSDDQIGRVQARDWEKLVALREKATRAFWSIITIRPRDGCEAHVLQQCVEKVVEKCWLRDKCFWVFEQKGTDEGEIGRGLHAHILFKLEGVKHGKKQKTKGQVASEVYDTCKRVADMDIEEQCIDVTVGKKEDLENAVNYLTGVKASEKKHKAQKIDVLWREQEGFKKFYGNLNLFI